MQNLLNDCTVSDLFIVIVFDLTEIHFINASDVMS